MKYCPKCNEFVFGDQSECPKCGVSAAGVSANGKITPSVRPGEEPADRDESVDAPSKGRPRLLAGVGAVAALLVCFGLIRACGRTGDEPGSGDPGASTSAGYGSSSNDPATRTAVGAASQDISRLRIGATVKKYDDLASVLKEMGIPFTMYNEVGVEVLKELDLLFISCGTPSRIAGGAKYVKGEEHPLRSFVGRGGVLYVSDLSFVYLVAAFPDYVKAFAKTGKAGVHLKCKVLSERFQQKVGEECDVYFDLDSWARLHEKGEKGEAITPILEAEYQGEVCPISFTFQHGRGSVVYTSFHNHAQKTAMEDKLIREILLTPVRAAVEREIGRGSPGAARDRRAR